MAGDIADGTVFKWRATAISGVTGFNGPSLHRDVANISDLDTSVAGFLGAKALDPGEVSLDVNWNPDLAIHNTLITDMAANTAGAFLIEWQNGTSNTWTYSANAIITDIAPGGSMGDKIDGSITFKLDGALTVTTA